MLTTNTDIFLLYEMCFNTLRFEILGADMSEHTQQDVLSVFSTAPAVWLIRRVCVNGEMWEVCSECREADFPALKLSKV